MVGYHLVSVFVAGYMWKLASLIGIHGVVSIVYLDIYVFLFRECRGLFIVVSCLFLLLPSFYSGIDLGRSHALALAAHVALLSLL